MAITSFEEKISTRLTTLESRFEALIAQDRPGSKAFGAGHVPFGGATGVLTDSANLTFASNILATPTIQLGGVAIRISAGTYFAIATNAVAPLGLTNNCFLFIHGGGNGPAIFTLNGGLNSTTELIDPGGVYSITAATANSINIYWSAGNARYEIENKRAAAINLRIFYTDAS